MSEVVCLRMITEAPRALSITRCPYSTSSLSQYVIDSLEDSVSVASSSGVSSTTSTSHSTASTSRGYDKPLYDVFLGGSCGNTVSPARLATVISLA